LVEQTILIDEIEELLKRKLLTKELLVGIGVVSAKDALD
jgi:hypothetical protein